MGTFDTDDTDDELLGSLFDDWEDVLSEGFGDILDASSSFGVVADTVAEDSNAAQGPAATMPAVDGSLSGLDAVSLSPRSTPGSAPPLELLGGVTRPAFDASLSALGARAEGAATTTPTLPRGDAPAVRDISLSQLNAEWFEEEEDATATPDADSTRFGDMSEHVARMALAEPAIDGQEVSPNERPTTPESRVGRPRSTTDEEIHHFLKGAAVGGVDVDNESVTRFSEAGVMGALEGHTRNESDAWSDFTASGVSGTSTASQRPSYSSLLGESAAADSAATRFGDSASIAAADHRESGVVASVSSSGVANASIGLQPERAPTVGDSSEPAAVEGPQGAEPITDAELPGAFEGSALGLSELGVSQLGDPELDNSQGFLSCVPVVRECDGPAQPDDDSRAPSIAPEASPRDEVSAAIAQASAQQQELAGGFEGAGTMRPYGGDGAPASTPAPVALNSTHGLGLNAGEEAVTSANGDGVMSEAVGDGRETNGARPREDSSIPDESEVTETSATVGDTPAPDPENANRTPWPQKDEAPVASAPDAHAGADSAQPTASPVLPVGIVIAMDHTLGPAEVERRVRDAVEKEGRCTLEIGPRLVTIDRIAGARGQWRAVEAAQDRAFAAGSVRSLIRRITSPRRGRDSVLDDLERRLARS